MIGEVVRLGRGLERKPLIYPTLYKTLVFTLFVGVFALIEHAIKGLWSGKGLTGGLVDFFEKGPYELLANSLVVFVACIPFFGVKELGRVLGQDKVRALLPEKSRPGNRGIGAGMTRCVSDLLRRYLAILTWGTEYSRRGLAAVSGSDARVPLELIFNERPRSVRCSRRRHTLGDDVRGSLDYALEHLGESLKLIVVLGHSGCGAVTAAVDVFLTQRATCRLRRSTRCARWSTG